MTRLRPFIWPIRKSLSKVWKTSRGLSEQFDLFPTRISSERTAIITSGAFVERVINRVKPNNIDEMLRGYYLERKIIFEYEAQHLITAKQARRMRQNVNELESYFPKRKCQYAPI